MKIFETLPIFLLISFGSSIPTTSMRCLSGPNLGPGLEEETPGHLIDCSGPNQVCLRVDAALYSASQTNNEDRFVVAGRCVKKDECTPKQCESTLAMFWSVNFTSEDYESSGVGGPSLFSTDYTDPLSSLFNIRYCNWECCSSDECNKLNTTFIRRLRTPQEQEMTTARQGAMSVQGLKIFIGITALTSSFLLQQNL